MQLFREQLCESLKNFYREISNYQLFINTNIKIKNFIFNEIDQIYLKIQNEIDPQINLPDINEKKDEVNVLFRSFVLFIT